MVDKSLFVATFFVVVPLFLLITNDASAQAEQAKQGYPTIEINWLYNRLETLPPIDQPFILESSIDPSITKVVTKRYKCNCLSLDRLQMLRAKADRDDEEEKDFRRLEKRCELIENDPPWNKPQQHFPASKSTNTLTVINATEEFYLRPNRDYCYVFEAEASKIDGASTQALASYRTDSAAVATAIPLTTAILTSALVSKQFPQLDSVTIPEHQIRDSLNKAISIAATTVLENPNFALSKPEVSRKPTTLPPKWIDIRTSPQPLGSSITTRIGVAYAPTSEALFPTFTTHLYSTPINKKADLADRFHWRQFRLRTSIFAGFSPVTLFSDTEVDIKNRFGVGNFVYGIGVRAPLYNHFLNKVPPFKCLKAITKHLDANIGIIEFNQQDANPLISKERRKRNIFLSASFDIQLQSILGPLASFLGAK